MANNKGRLPVCEDISALASPLLIGVRRVENRLLIQPMEGCDATPSGAPDELTYRRYMRYAKGGAGVIWIEATTADIGARSSPRQLCLTKENAGEFARLCAAIKETAFRANGFEPLLIIQLTHSGRFTKPIPVIAYHHPYLEPRLLPDSCIASDSHLETIGQALAQAAQLAQLAGFDGVEIKGCHKYLYNELFSAHIRKGKYGGVFANRTRLLRETVEQVKSLCSSSFLIAVRLNLYDGFPYPYGFGMAENGSLQQDLSEPLALIKELNILGVSLINASMNVPYVSLAVHQAAMHADRTNPIIADGEPEPQRASTERMLFSCLAAAQQFPQMAFAVSGLTALKKEAPFICAGMLTKAPNLLFGFGRQAYAYPDFPQDVLKQGVMQLNKLCTCCGKCVELIRSGSKVGCVVRDKDVYLPFYQKYCKKEDA